jgi:hypothetical protein
MGFVEDLIDYNKHRESSTSFWKWSAYSAISAVLRDNCFIVQGDTNLYANIYVLLLADSASHRKGKPVEMCRDLCMKIRNTKIISGRSSIQAILEALAAQETDRKTGKVTKGGSAIFFAKELAAALVGDQSSVGILTDIYDYDPDWTNRLRSGSFRIERLVFSMLAASNEALLRGVYDNTAINGGLLGRTFLIKPSETRPSNSLLSVPNQEIMLLSLEEKLGKIAALHGAFKVSKEAEKVYNGWYIPFRNGAIHRGDKTGVLGRLHTSVLKLSIIITANHAIGSGNMEITKEYMNEAITECMLLIPNYQNFIVGTGKSKIADAGRTILQDMLLKADKSITRIEIVQRHWSEFDPEVLDMVMEKLAAALLVDVNSAGASNIKYTLTTRAIELMEGKDTKNDTKTL